MEKRHQSFRVLENTVRRFSEEIPNPELFDQLVISLIETHVSIYVPIAEVRTQLLATGLGAAYVEKLIAQALRNIADKLDKSKS